MNIYICDCPNTFNYGSMMMGENFIFYFNKISKASNVYYVETDDEINIQRLRNATGIMEIYQAPVNALFHQECSKYDYLLSWMKLKKAVSQFADKIDFVLVLGGDDFTEDYGWKEPLVNAVKFDLLMRAGISVVLLGQTIGPFHSFRKPMMKRLLGKTSRIYPRDSLTYQYLTGMGLTNISLTDDLALLPLAKQEIKERTGEYIIICPSEIIYHYSRDGSREKWIEFNLFMIDVIMDSYADKKLVLLAHVLRPEHADDRVIVNELYGLLKEKYKDRVIAVSNEQYPYEVRNLIQQALFVVSGRMHPVVSSFQCGIPAVAISYSSKFWGVIGERYGLGEFIIDVRDLNYMEMRQKFVHLLDRVGKEYSQIADKIKSKNELTERSIMGALKEIRDLEETCTERR